MRTDTCTSSISFEIPFFEGKAEQIPMGEDLQRVAFRQLKTVCDKLMLNLSRDNVIELIGIIDTVPKSAFSALFEYVIFPIQFHLWRYCTDGDKISTTVLLELTHCLKITLRKSSIDDARIFFQLNLLLLRLVMKSDISELNETVSEDAKYGVMDCICTLYEIADYCSDDVLCQIYSGRSDYNIHIQVVYACTRLARNERLIKLRVIALKCLLIVMRVHKTTISATNCDQRIKLRSRVADVVAPLFPGIISTAYTILKSSSIFHRDIYIFCTRIFCRSVALLFENVGAGKSKVGNHDSKCDGPAVGGELPSGVDSEISCSEIRTDDWFRLTADKLTAYTRCLISLCGHSQWKVRLELVEGVTLVLTNCCNYIRPIQTTLLQVLVILSRDTFEEISVKAESVLKELLHSNSLRGHEILGTVEEDFIFLLDSLNSLLDSTDEQILLSQLNLLHGFVNILDLKQICRSSVYNRRLFTTLEKIVRFDATTMSSFYKCGIQDTSLPCTNQLYSISWKNTKYLTSRTEEVVKSILSAIGRKIDVEHVTFYLLDALENRPDDRKELVYLVNNIIIIDRPECDKSCFKLMKLILNVYLDPVHWYVVIFCSDIDSVSSAATIQSNLLQVCLLTEGIGNMAVCLKRKFAPLLVYCLYPVVERAGCNNVFLNAVGLKALEKMTNVCGYSNTMELITDNIDYITHCVSVKLRNVERSLGVFDVLYVVIAHSGENALPILCDVIQVLLTSDEIIHDNYCEGFLRVFQVFVHKLRYWFAPAFNDLSVSNAPDEKLSELLHRLDEFRNPKGSRKAYSSCICDVQDENVNLLDVFGGSEYSLADSCEEVTDNGNPQEVSGRTAPIKKKYDAMPQHVQLIISVARRISQMLSYKSIRGKILVLEILTEILLVLHNVEEDWLLPVVHDMWSPLANRFRYDCAEPVILARCFGLLSVMVATAKDFLKSRTLVDVLPIVTDFLSRSSRESELKDKNSVYRVSQKYKLQRTLLSHLGYVAVNAGLRENELNSVLTAATPFLSSRQPLPLQRACIVMFLEIQYAHRDFVRIYLFSIWPSTFIACGIKGEEFRRINIKGKAETDVVADYRNNVMSLIGETCR